MNLVNELQVSAETDEVLMVLRKTKRLASKLGRQDINEWLEHEQSGYLAGKPVPDYRNVSTTLAYNTNGYIPAGFGFVRNGIEDLPSCGLNLPFPIIKPISTILTWIEAESKGGGKGIFFPVEAGTEMDRSIRQIIQFNPMFADQITFLFHFNMSQVKAIPERIKDKVLDWACALETAGVTGEGLTFSTKEKQIAHSVTFNIHNSQIEQLNNAGSNQKG